MSKKPTLSIHARVLGDASIATGVTTIDPMAEIIFAAALYLVIQRKEPISRRTIQALLWPDASDRVASHRLRQTLLKLRQLGMPVEMSGKGHIGLNGTPVTVDYEEFLATRKFVENGNNDALVMLPAYEPRFSQAYLEWLDSQKAEVNASMTRVMLGIIARHRVKGEWVEVERNATRLLRFQPYNEEATLALAEAYAMRGGKLQAMEILDRYLSEVGNGPTDLRLPATVMRRRIADRMHPRVESIAGQSPLVGRGNEMEQLAGLLEKSRQKNGQACLVWGDAGVGKSRLLAEFATFASLQGIPTQRVQCRPGDPHHPLSVFVDLVPGLRSMRGAIGCSPESFSYLDKLTKHEPTSVDLRANEEDSEFVYAKLNQSLFDLVDAVSDEGCLIVLIEDIHWLDPTSAKLLHEMVAWSAEHSIMFAFTGRDSPESWLSDFAGLPTQIHLSPLDLAASKDLLLGVVRQQGREISDSYLDWCVRVAEGNPYFLQELANQWVERGDEQTVPPSLAAVLNDRIGRLTPDSLLLLQVCALLENNSTLDRIERVIDFEAHRMLRAINDLGIAGMLVIESDETGTRSTNRLLSRHDLLSNIALARLTPPARAFLHRRIGGMFEAEIAGERSTSILWECANHWQRSGNVGRALQLARSCATNLMEVGLPGAAAEAYQKSLAYCTTPRETLQILEAQAHAYYRTQSWTQVREVVSKARSLRSTIEPRRCLHDDLELMTLRAEWRNFRYDRTIQKALRCLNDSAASATHRVEAGSMVLMLLDQVCDQDAMPSVFKAIERIAETPGVSIASRLQAKLVFHTTCGDLSVALSAARSLIEVQRSEGNVSDLLRALTNGPVPFRTAGLFEDAEKLLLEALSVADKHKLDVHLVDIYLQLANLELERGRFDNARRWFETIEARQLEYNKHEQPREWTGVAARLALLTHRPSDARKFLPRNLQAIRNNPVAFSRAYGAALCVATELACGNVPSSELLSTLEDAHIQTRRAVYQAYPAYALHAGLNAAGRGTHASKRLAEYVTEFRRESYPPPAYLLNTFEMSKRLAGQARRR